MNKVEKFCHVCFLDLKDGYCPCNPKPTSRNEYESENTRLKKSNEQLRKACEMALGFLHLAVKYLPDLNRSRLSIIATSRRKVKMCDEIVKVPPKSEIKMVLISPEELAALRSELAEARILLARALDTGDLSAGMEKYIDDFLVPVSAADGKEKP